MKHIALVYNELNTSAHTSYHKALPISEDSHILIWIVVKNTHLEEKTRKKFFTKIQQTIVNSFSENQEKNVEDNFENTLKEANRDIEVFQKEHGNIGEIHSVISVVEGNTLHVTQTGQSELYLLRGGTFSIISEGLAPEKNNHDTQLFYE